MVDRAKREGYRIITIPENIKEKINGLEDIEGNIIRDLDEFTSEYNDSFKFKFIKEKDLTKEEKEIFERTKEILELIGGKPKKVKEIKISETMRIDKNLLIETSGLWEPLEQIIIIKRNQLKDLKSYSGTLLHEISHVKSGESDVSIEFENELTKVIGKISHKHLEQNTRK